jgi:hypothetical protein
MFVEAGGGIAGVASTGGWEMRVLEWEWNGYRFGAVDVEFGREVVRVCVVNKVSGGFYAIFKLRMDDAGHGNIKVATRVDHSTLFVPPPEWIQRMVDADGRLEIARGLACYLRVEEEPLPGPPPHPGPPRIGEGAERRGGATEAAGARQSGAG